MRALADDLRSTPFVAKLGRYQREIGWLLLQDLGPHVRAGCPGWLFLVDELKIHRNRQHHATTRAQIVAQLHEKFAANGTRLVVLLVPDKSRVESEQLCQLKRSRQLFDRFDNWIQQLNQAGVEVIELNTPLSEQRIQSGSAFARTDTHWNLDGARAAAQFVAQQLTALGFSATNSIDLTVHYGAIQPNWGDLVRLAGIDQLPEPLRPNPDWVFDVRFTANLTNQIEVDAGALFGDIDQQRIALVGTSFSQNAHFSDFLVKFLHRDIGNFAYDGAGFFQSMKQFLKQENLDKVTLVLWEIPERLIEEPLSTVSKFSDINSL